MRFNEKFNLLMKMSNATNTRLAHALGVDPSLVSRWRTGSREPGDSSRYIQLIGVYFATQARQDFQKVALLELTGHSLEDKNVGENVIANHLIRWLSDESKISTESIQLLLDSIGSSGGTESPIPRNIAFPPEPAGTPLTTETFYGDKGIQSAAVKLMLQALTIGRGAKLLLYSDEPIKWMVENPEFTQLWAYLITECIKNGSRIEIIHTLARDSAELAVAVQRWLPFYLTGAITSYYYPHKRDGLFNHTAFTLQGYATVSSTSVKGQERNCIAYHYATDIRAISCAEVAFAAQLEECKPLVRTLTGDNVSQYLDQQSAFFAQGAGPGAGLQSLPLSGMPAALLQRILTQTTLTDARKDELVQQHAQREQSLIDHMAHTSFKMVISLPRITDTLKGLVPALIPELLSLRPCYYQPEEFLDQILHIIRLLENYPRMELYILPRKHMHQQVQLFAIQGAGMMVLKPREPRFAFISEQKDLISATFSFIQQEMARIPKRERTKSFIIGKLQAYAEKIRAGLENRDA